MLRYTVGSVQRGVAYRVGKGLDEAMQGLLRWRVPGSRYFPPGHVFAYDVARLYTFERRTTPQTIVDVGANVGDVALYLRRWFPHATIHAIEPISQTFRTLQERSRHDPQSAATNWPSAPRPSVARSCCARIPS